MTRPPRVLSLWICLCVCAGGALAQPAPQPSPDKTDAKSLMASGVKLLEAKDYLGALAVFRSAYARFPSAKILLNIGTTLKALGRDADAANAYQAYLDSSDADPAKRGDVEAVIAEIDKTNGRLDIVVTPADAEVQINNGEWLPAAKAKRARVPPGSFTVNARKDKYQTEAKQAQISAGELATITLVLTALPEQTRIIQVPVTNAPPDTGVRAEVEPRSRLGVLALAHIDVPFDRAPRGGAVLVGATGDITSALRAQAALIIGPHEDSDVTLAGAYAGASFAFLTGRARPHVSAGFPVFFSDGARFGVRAAGGIEYTINRHVSLVAELGFEYVFNPEPMYRASVFVPAIGAAGRL